MNYWFFKKETLQKICYCLCTDVFSWKLGQEKVKKSLGVEYVDRLEILKSSLQILQSAVLCTA